MKPKTPSEKVSEWTPLQRAEHVVAITKGMKPEIITGFITGAIVDALSAYQEELIGKIMDLPADGWRAKREAVIQLIKPLNKKEEERQTQGKKSIC